MFTNSRKARPQSFQVGQESLPLWSGKGVSQQILTNRCRLFLDAYSENRAYELDIQKCSSA